MLQEELRPYFSLPKVMDGLFSLANTLFGIEIEAADGLAPVYFSTFSFMICFIYLEVILMSYYINKWLFSVGVE